MLSSWLAPSPACWVSSTHRTRRRVARPSQKGKSVDQKKEELMNLYKILSCIYTFSQPALLLLRTGSFFVGLNVSCCLLFCLEGHWDWKKLHSLNVSQPKKISGAKCVSLALEQRNVENVPYAPTKRYQNSAMHIKHSKPLYAANCIMNIAVCTQD